jgi:hypothetical protein
MIIMINLITSRFATAAVFAISGVTAAGMAIALASLLSANPKGPDAAGRAVALVACAGLAGTCLTLAAGAATDAD